MSKLNRMTRAEYDHKVAEAAARWDAIIAACIAIGLLVLVLTQLYERAAA